MPMIEIPKPNRWVGKVYIHCSASDDDGLVGEDMVNVVREWHRARGFSDVGYHLLIDKRGGVFLGRDLEEIPAAQRGYNAGTIAIMVHGLEDFTAESLNALRSVCGTLNEMYEGRLTFHGHCEVSSKACPVFDYKTLLGLDRFQRMA